MFHKTMLPPFVAQSQTTVKKTDSAILPKVKPRKTDTEDNPASLTSVRLEESNKNALIDILVD